MTVNALVSEGRRYIARTQDIFQMPTFSNEAEELHRMCQKFISINGGAATSEVLAGFFDVERESHEYFSFIAAIRLRFKRFLDVAETSFLNDRHKSNLRAAVIHLRSFTDLRFAPMGWNDTRRNAFDEKHLMALDMAGSGLATIAPVVVLGDDERKGYINDLHRALDEIEGSGDFVAQMVSNSIRTAIKMIELFDIFGSAAIGEKLFETHAITKQAAEIVPQNRRKVYAKAAAIIGIVAGGFIYADSAVTAIENFYTRAGKVAEVLSLAHPPEQKLLPAPAEKQEQDQTEGTNSEAEEELDV